MAIPRGENRNYKASLVIIDIPGKFDSILVFRILGRNVKLSSAL
jgi:hypothetical protein